MPKKKTISKRKRGRLAVKRLAPGNMYRFGQGQMGRGAPYYINREVPVYIPYKNPLKDITEQGKGVTSLLKAWEKPILYGAQIAGAVAAAVAPYKISQWQAEHEAEKERARYDTQMKTAKQKKEAEYQAKGEELRANYESTKKVIKSVRNSVWSSSPSEVPLNQCSAHYLDAPYTEADVSRAISFTTDTVAPTAATLTAGAMTAYAVIKKLRGGRN